MHNLVAKFNNSIVELSCSRLRYSSDGRNSKIDKLITEF